MSEYYTVNIILVIDTAPALPAIEACSFYNQCELIHMFSRSRLSSVVQEGSCS